MSNRREQLKAAAGEVEGWLDKMLVGNPRLFAVGCGVAGILVGLLLAGGL
jgi:hypothetical protein